MSAHNKAKPHIFLIDDSPIIAKASQLLLSRSGFDVSICTNEFEAIQTLESQPEKFQLILTDQKMPHITGIELASEIRKTNQQIPIVLLTGDLTEKEQQEAKKVGIQHCLIKPISHKEMVQALQQALAER